MKRGRKSERMIDRLERAMRGLIEARDRGDMEMDLEYRERGRRLLAEMDRARLRRRGTEEAEDEVYGE